MSTSNLVPDHNQPITAATVGHLPIIAHYLRTLGLVEMDVEPGIIVLGFRF